MYKLALVPRCLVFGNASIKAAMAHMPGWVFQISRYHLLVSSNLIPPGEFATKFSVTLSTSTVEHDVRG
jgi:hypothetical protein